MRRLDEGVREGRPEFEFDVADQDTRVARPIGRL